MARIAGIDRDDGSVKVDFLDKVVEYESDELDEINLAYATSVHKSQGSEYPVVVLPLHTSHYLIAASKHSLYRGDARQEAGRHRRQPQSTGDGDSQFSRRETQHRLNGKAFGVGEAE